MSPSERRVAHVLLTAYPVAGLGTLAELAARARVSPPTVLRLLGRVRFSGFSDLQLALRLELEERLATTAGSFPVHGSGSERGLAITLLHEAVENIAADAQALTPKEISDVVRVLARPSGRVLTMGGSLTQALALYLHLQLEAMRPRCRYVGSSVSPAWNELAEIGRRDTLVVFEVRPYEGITTQICTWAKGRGATIVLFTDPWLSPVAGLASHVLITRSKSSSPFDSYAPCLALVEGIVAAVAAELGDRAQPRIARSEAMRTGCRWEPNGSGVPAGSL